MKTSLSSLVVAASMLSACELFWGIDDTSVSRDESPSGGSSASGGSQGEATGGASGGAATSGSGGAPLNTGGENEGKGGVPSDGGDTSGGDAGRADTGGANTGGTEASTGGLSTASDGGTTLQGGGRGVDGPGAGASGEGGEGGVSPRGGAGGVSGEAGAGGEAGAPSLCGPAIDGMVCIPGATFVMGSTITGSSFHEVTLKAFQIMTHEVTVAEYDACAIAGGCSSAGIAGSDTWTMDCNEGVPGREKHPINCVNWNNASAYCKWKGWRLLTEEEWQYAATRGGVRLFPWGNALPDASRLNIAGEEWGAVSWGNDNYLYTAPVGSFPLGATEDGIFDLGGNVWEMVSSHLCDYPKSACNNCPLGESCLNSCDANACATDQFVHRGGAWSEGPEWSPQNGGSWTNWRGGHPPTFYTSYVGFRCGRSVP